MDASRCSQSVRRSSRLRSWLVAYVLVSLAWPAAGMLPAELIALDAANTAIAAHEHAADAGHNHDGADAASHRHDASDVPGSPTHPDDHNCFECQVLQHLTRCVLPDVGPVIVPPLPTCVVARVSSSQAAPTTYVAPRPPIRGPPSIDR